VLRVLVDYDGTLVPIARSPDLAAPDEDVLALLHGLAAKPGVDIEIVSGRSREAIEEWFGHLSLTLWAEHGFWHRSAPGEAWDAAARVAPDWMNRIRPILEQFSSNTPGSHVEAKSASLAWHYRRAEREFGARQAHKLRLLLGNTLSNQAFDVLEGKKVIEVRLRGVSKALVAQRVRAETGPDDQLVAIGDDRTDEDLFRALPSSSATIAVGNRPTCAKYRVANYRAVRDVLRIILLGRPPSPAPVSRDHRSDASTIT
jgi:trehalose 6-phosphate synthase/phosphatase